MPESKKQTLRLLIAEDHVVVRQALRVMLEMEPELEVVGEAPNGEEALRLAHELKPDLVLMDIRMEGMDGVEATRRMRQELPDIGVLVLTGYGEDAVLLRAVEAGAHGFLLKDASAVEVKEAIQRAKRIEEAAGDWPFSGWCEASRWSPPLCCASCWTSLLTGSGTPSRRMPT